MPSDLASIILPIHNQADHIEGIVEEYLEALARVPIDHELILVENASRDRSPEICRRLAERFGNIYVIHTEKGGWGHAVRLGIKAAKGERILYTNSARTSPQDLMLLLLYAVANPNAVIKANRRIRDNWQRRLGSLLYNLECRALFDVPYWDINGTPKVFPRRFEKLLALTRDDDLIDAEFILVCRQNDYPVLEVPIRSTRRHGGASTTSYGSAVHMYREAFALRRRLDTPEER
jgi:glycosyltransferase involved in cell wall biosynthesis